MFSSKITTTCLIGVLVFAFLGRVKATLGVALSAALDPTDGGGAERDARGAASDPGVTPRTRAVSAPAEAHRPKAVPRRGGMSVTLRPRAAVAHTSRPCRGRRAERRSSR